jgi:hypothetical protein
LPDNRGRDWIGRPMRQRHAEGHSILQRHG